MNFFSLGTIIELNNGPKVMIIGYYPLLIEKKKIYDYLGCYYPYGVLDSSKSISFNQKDVKKVIWERKNDEEMESVFAKLKLFDENKKKELLQNILDKKDS